MFQLPTGASSCPSPAHFPDPRVVPRGCASAAERVGHTGYTAGGWLMIVTNYSDSIKGYVI